MTPIADFRSALIAAYRDYPAQVLAHPLWAVLPQIDHFQTSYQVDAAGVSRLEAWDDESVYILWRRAERRPSLLVRRRLAFVQVAMMHQDFLDPDTVAGFTTRRPYFRLTHRPGDPLEAATLPAGLRFAPVNPLHEAEAAAALIARCAGEDEEPPDAAAIRAWADAPTYSPDLWLWLVDEASGERVGLGIGDFDAALAEAALPPVRLLPGYPEEAGRALVVELLRRTDARAPFTTLSAPLPFPERLTPGAFYKTCGFSGDDVWWLLGHEA